MEFPIARQLFYQEVQVLEHELNLAKAALHIAQEEYPELDPDEYLAALDTMASEVEERLPSERYPLQVIKALNQYLFEDLKFKGNRQQYYDPRNSFLNEVIERRTGIPITLSVIYLEIARRLSFPMVGIGMPGHFLLQPQFENVGIFVDSFNQGEVLFPEDCQARLHQIYGSEATLQSHYLAPISHHQVLIRILTNLKHIYLNQGDITRSLAAIERILLVDPNALIDLRDRGLLYYQTSRWSEAKQDLERYLESLPLTAHHSADVAIIRQLLEHLRKEDD